MRIEKHEKPLWRTYLANHVDSNTTTIYGGQIIWAFLIFIGAVVSAVIFRMVVGMDIVVPPGVIVLITTLSGALVSVYVSLLGKRTGERIVDRKINGKNNGTPDARDSD